MEAGNRWRTVSVPVKALAGWAGLLLLAVGVTAPAVSEDGEAKERRLLAGAWRGFIVEGRGERPDEGPFKLDLAIRPDGITGQQGDKDLGAGTYRLDVSQNPRTIDATGTTGE